jgi:hypothetical protein
MKTDETPQSGHQDRGVSLFIFVMFCSSRKIENLFDLLQDMCYHGGGISHYVQLGGADYAVGNKRV